MIIKEQKKTTMEPVPAGIHHGIFQAVIDLGTQEPDNPQFKKGRKTYIVWELPHETYQVEGKPVRRKMGKEYTVSMHKKSTLRAMLESARGKAYSEAELAAGVDLSKVLGVNCQLNVVHKAGSADPTKTFARISNVVPLGKGTPALLLESGVQQFDIPESGPIVLPEGMPEWLAEKIKASDEWKERHGVPTTAGVGAGADDDVPM